MLNTFVRMLVTVPRNGTLLIALIPALVACGNAPRIQNFNGEFASPDSQKLLSSAHHWKLIAIDVANQSKKLTSSPNSESQDTPLRCVWVERAENESPFQRVLDDAIVASLLETKGQRVKLGNLPAKDCGDRIKVSSTVVQLNATKETHYRPGELTVLTEGLVVLRNVARALSESSIVGTVLLGEAVFSVSPYFLPTQHVAEVAVTVSRVNSDGYYESQFTNIYYIDAKDTKFYADSKNVEPEAKPPYKSEHCEQKRERKPHCQFTDDDELPRLHPKPKPLALSRIDSSVAVIPTQISVCDTRITFRIDGENLERDAARYSFGSIQSKPHAIKSFRTSFQNGAWGRSIDFVEIEFDGLRKANIGLGQVYLNIASTDGLIAKPITVVDGKCPGGVSAKPVVAKPVPKAKTNLVLIPKNSDLVDLCASRPLELAVSGPNASSLESATITLPGAAGGTFPAVISKEDNGKKISLAFHTLPSVSTDGFQFIPNPMSVSLQLDNNRKDSATVKVTCGTQITKK